MGLTQFDEKDIFNAAHELTSINYVAGFTIATSPTRPLRIDQLLVTSTDTVDHEVSLYLNNAYSDRALLGTFLVPAGSGTTHLLPPVDALPAIAALLTSIQLDVNDQLQIIIPVVITAATEIDFQSVGGYL